MDLAGLWVGIGGLVAGIIGLIFAFLARRAAKSAEDAAERASEEARRTVSRSHRMVETVRAISTVNQLKVLHRNGDWEYALELYPELRSVLSEIQASMPEELAELRDVLADGIYKIRGIEDSVSIAWYERGVPASVPQFDTILNDIHQSLLRLLGTDVNTM